MHLIVAYDIPSDRRRTRLARHLVRHLNRVQKSVFEGEIREGRYETLRGGILKNIDPSEDSVRIYRLCGRCQAATDVVGLAEGLFDEEDIIL